MRLFHYAVNNWNGEMSSWSGEPGYVHCLLAAMSEGALHTFEIVGSEQVPNLIDLLAHNDGLQKWVSSQQLQFDTLNAKQIIRVLRHNASVRGLPSKTRHQELKSLNAINDGDTVFPSVFDVRIGPFDRFARVDRAADTDPRVLAMIPEAEAAKSGKGGHF